MVSISIGSEAQQLIEPGPGCLERGLTQANATHQSDSVSDAVHSKFSTPTTLSVCIERPGVELGRALPMAALLGALRCRPGL